MTSQTVTDGQRHQGTTTTRRSPEHSESTTNDQASVVSVSDGESMMTGLARHFSRLQVFDNPPPETPKVEEVEKLAATEMNNLSMESREQILYDLHGISEKMPKETPELLSARLEDMQMAIELMFDSEKEAYNLALTINPLYVMDREFRLKFLRADLFDASLAAGRYTRHFQAKLELFGRDLLCQDITQDDLDNEGDRTLECLYSGWMQELPLRDVSGRLVSVMTQKARDPTWTVEEKCRAIWYRRMINTVDIDSQRNGAVLTIFNSEQEFDKATTWKVGRLVSCIPLRFLGIHICLLPEYFIEQQESTLSLGRLAMDSSERHRYRTHTGSLAEIKYKLQTFGIPVSVLPLDDSGAFSSEYNRDFLSKQRLVERQSFESLMMASIGEFFDLNDSNGDIHQQQPQHQENEDRRPPPPPPTSSSSVIGTPGKHDVLMGRGRSCQEHSGNIRFRFLIEQNLDRYDATPKHKKMPIALEILKEIHQTGGRFLTPSEMGWKEIDEITAREKVSSCFRSFRKVKGGGKTKTGSSSPKTPVPKRLPEHSDSSLSEKHSRVS